MGVFNGDTTDDLTAPDGRVLDSNATTEVEIFDHFGEPCKLPYGCLEITGE